MTGICQRIAAGMPEHVSVRLERQLGFLSCPLDQPIEAVGSERAAPLRHEYEKRPAGGKEI